MRFFVLLAIVALNLAPALSPAQEQAAQSPSDGSYLGIGLVDITADRARTLKLSEGGGVEVKAVEEGGPAEKAGIQPGDVLLSYNGEKILGARQLIRLVQETPADRKVKVQCWRDGKERSAVIVTSPPHPANAPLRYQAFSFSDEPLYPRTATIVPRPLLVWTDLVMGMEFEEVDSQLGEYFGVSGGVLIRAVAKGSPADKAGLKAGDVITSMSQKPIASAHDFASCLRKPGTTASLIVVRNHKKLTVIAPENGQ